MPPKKEALREQLDRLGINRHAWPGHGCVDRMPPKKVPLKEKLERLGINIDLGAEQSKKSTRARTETPADAAARPSTKRTKKPVMQIISPGKEFDSYSKREFQQRTARFFSSIGQ